jgi:hypothetical protein
MRLRLKSPNRAVTAATGIPGTGVTGDASALGVRAFPILPKAA